MSKVVKLSATMLLVAFTLGGVTIAQAAETKVHQVCVVKEHSKPVSPLNIRSTPNGKIIGKINIGQWVYVTKWTKVQSGFWNYIQNYDGSARGWAFNDGLGLCTDVAEDLVH